MKIKVYGEESGEKEVNLRLIVESGVVNLVVVDADGSIASGGYLAKITEAGIETYMSVAKYHGLACNGHRGSITVEQGVH